MASLLDRLLDKLYHTQLAFIALASFVAGAAISWAWDFFVVDSGAPHWVLSLPVHGLGDALLIGAFMLIVFEVIVRTIIEMRGERKLDDAIEKIFTQPATADAVAGSPMGEQLVLNALRLLTDGDAEIARALRDRLEPQLAGGSRLWRDLVLTATVTPWSKGPEARPEPLFDLTLSCSYKAVIQHPQLWFLCTSDKNERDTAGRDPGNAATWLIEPQEPLSATDPETFTVVDVQVDGQPLHLVRSQAGQSQKYVAEVPDTVLGRSVSVSYTYRVLVLQSANLLRLDTSQLTLGFSAKFTYSNTAIRHVSTAAYLGNTPTVTAVNKMPGSVRIREVTVARDGLVLPGEGVVFSWVTNDRPVPEPAR
jgi:hypothetical protein